MAMFDEYQPVPMADSSGANRTRGRQALCPHLTPTLKQAPSASTDLANAPAAPSTAAAIIDAELPAAAAAAAAADAAASSSDEEEELTPHADIYITSHEVDTESEPSPTAAPAACSPEQRGDELRTPESRMSGCCCWS